MTAIMAHAVTSFMELLEKLRDRPLPVGLQPLRAPLYLGRRSTTFVEILRTNVDNMTWLDPINAEACPGSMNYPAAILTRIEGSLSSLHEKPVERWGVGKDDPLLIRLCRIKTDAVIASMRHRLDMDPDPYAIEVLRAERCLLGFHNGKAANIIRELRDEHKTVLFGLPVLNVNSINALTSLIGVMEALRFLRTPDILVVACGSMPKDSIPILHTADQMGVTIIEVEDDQRRVPLHPLTPQFRDQP